MNSYELQSFFYGTLLGDSYIIRGAFYCKQISKDLIEFKKKIIDKYLPNANPTINEYDEYIDKNGVHHQKYYQLSTKTHEYFKKLQKLFYINGKKVVPKGVISKLTPLGFAMWFADDGTTVLVGYNSSTGGAKSRRVQICTDSFTLEEHRDIIIPELESLGFECKYVNRDKFVKLTFLNMKIMQTFFLNIGIYFYKYFPSLLYKMDMGYRNESLNKTSYVIPDYKLFYIQMSAHPSFRNRMKEKEDIVQTATLNCGLGN